MSETSPSAGHEAVTVRVNGELVTLAPDTTLAALVATLVESPRGVAVALNEEVVPKSRWDEARLADGDRVEVLTVAQGGCR